MQRRGWIPLRLALFGGAAISILGGASFNIQGHSGEAGVLALLAGSLVCGAGLIFRRLRWSAAMAAGGLVLTLVGARFDLRSTDLHINVAGLCCLGLGGVLGTVAYSTVTEQLQRRLRDLEILNARLEEQHRLFVAATEEASLQGGDLAQLALHTAEQLEVELCGYYVTTPDGAQYAPQLPGLGLDRIRAQPIVRATNPPRWILEVESGQMVETAERRDLPEIFRGAPPSWRLESALVAPIRAGEHVAGFLLLANRPGGFSADDKRLATTLALRAGADLARLHAVALSQKEAARYQLLNDLVQEAAGKSQDEVIRLILGRGCQLVGYDAGRVALFHQDATYTMAGGSPIPAPLAGSPLGEVYAGESVVRQATQAEGLFSGLAAQSETAAVAEALVPIRGRHGVVGALCIGRKPATGFQKRDLPALEELGAMAGVALENSRVIAQASARRVQIDSVLDTLAETAEAIGAVAAGARPLEQKLLETAMRLQGCPMALLTRVDEGGQMRLVARHGLPEGFSLTEFPAREGLIGTVASSARALAVADLGATFEMADRELSDAGVRAAACVPVFAGDRLWGALALLHAAPRRWSALDLRVLQTLAGAVAKAVESAELYERAQVAIRELSDIQDGLEAVTSTVEIELALDRLLDWAARTCGAEIGCVVLSDPDRQGDDRHRDDLVVAAAYGTDRSSAERLALGAASDLVLEVLTTDRPFTDRVDVAESGIGPLSPSAVICVPIGLGGQPLGALLLAGYSRGRGFSDRHERVLTRVASQAAAAIHSARLLRDREALIRSALIAFAAAVDERQPHTAGHSERVTEYALVIARQLNYSPGDPGAWERLRQGCLVHDIGKIGVPDAILNKPERLTARELEIMRSHPVTGWRVLSVLKTLDDELQIVRHHHERYDGRGYPDGKHGEELPLAAWIVSVADAFDAMTSDRPYRKGVSLELAVAEIVRGSGKQFHPEVSRAVAAAADAGLLKVLGASSDDVVEQATEPTLLTGQ